MEYFNFRREFTDYDPVVRRILEVGHYLGEEGFDNWALTAPQAINALEELRANSQIVLGGDVLIKVGNRYKHAMANWFYEPKLEENHHTRVEKGYKIAVDYINRYPDPGAFYTMVISR